MATYSFRDIEIILIKNKSNFSFGKASIATEICTSEAVGIKQKLPILLDMGKSYGLRRADSASCRGSLVISRSFRTGFLPRGESVGLLSGTSVNRLVSKHQIHAS